MKSGWQRLEDLWDAVHALPEAERDAFLETLQAEDPALGHEIEALMASSRQAEVFFGKFVSVVESGANQALNESQFEELQAGLAGRYALEHEIGEGGMATVFLARDPRHGRDVALKVLKPELAATLGVDRFLREIEIAAGLRHPHIVPVYDSGKAGAFLYYVMPYEPGNSLREHLVREGALPVDEAVRILRDVVDALGHAHEQGIVHRDIKPENVLLSARHAAVADFGIAKAVAEATRDSPDTAAGIALGTPRYMAPEQATGDPVDHRADLYAVGVLAYEMLEGKPPFTGETSQEILSAHLTQQPPPLTAQRPALPSLLVELVMRCLAKRPADRWQRADEILARLEVLGSHAPDEQGAPALADKATRPHRALTKVWLALVAVMAVAAALPWALPRLPWSRGPERGPSIAVLPFVNRGDPGDAALADGMTVELISQLAAAGLRPIASTSVFAFRDRHTDVRAIADSLEVSYLLEGDWQKIGSALRVRVALIDARDGSTLWSRPYHRTFGDVFDIQDDIARAVAREAGVRLGAERPVSAGRARTVIPAAYEHYLLGSDPRVFRTDSTARQALAHFQKAVALDSIFAGAYAGLAIMHLRVAPLETPNMPRKERIRLAEQFVGKAVALDNSLAEANEVLGIVRLNQLRFGEAETHLLRAANLDPNRSSPHVYLGYLHLWKSNWPEVLNAARRALDIDALSPGAHVQLAHAFLVNGRCREAREHLAHIADVRPPVGRGRLVAAQCYALEGKWTEAIAQIGNDSRGRRLRGLLLARSGRRDEALGVLADVLSQAQRSGGDAFDVVFLYAGLRDFDQAFAWLDRSIADYTLNWGIMEPVFQELRDDPRFDLVQQRLGLQKR